MSAKWYEARRILLIVVDRRLDQLEAQAEVEAFEYILEMMI